MFLKVYKENLDQNHGEIPSHPSLSDITQTNKTYKILMKTEKREVWQLVGM